MESSAKIKLALPTEEASQQLEEPSTGVNDADSSDDATEVKQVD